MHGADGKYLFGNVKEGNLPLTENEIKMKDIIVNMLVSFAKTGYYLSFFIKKIIYEVLENQKLKALIGNLLVMKRYFF